LLSPWWFSSSRPWWSLPTSGIFSFTRN
jgi:hypothetical protein